MLNIIYVLESPEDISLPSIFLAGPTYRLIEGNSTPKSWREEAILCLQAEKFNGNVFVPECRDNTFPINWTYSRQVDWEIKWLKASSAILFWIPRSKDLPAFTTNIEFGEFMNSGKIAIGAPDESEKNEYIKERCVRFGLPFSNTLQTVVQKTIEKIKIDSATKTFFTSDTHFGEERTLKLWRRPFSSVQDMDWQMVARWNSVVSNNDIVYHLGDFGFPKMIKHLNGKSIIIIPGNYDSEQIKNELKTDERVSIMENGITINLNNKFVGLIHGPCDAYKPTANFYLFGHIHQLGMVKTNGLNVGMDCHHYKPIDSDAVVFYMNAIKNHYDENVFSISINSCGTV